MSNEIKLNKEVCHQCHKKEMEKEDSGRHTEWDMEDDIEWDQYQSVICKTTYSPKKMDKVLKTTSIYYPPPDWCPYKFKHAIASGLQEDPEELKMKRKVLFVDDDPDILELYEQGINQQDFEYVIKTTSTDAINYLLENQVEILVCDGKLPKTLNELPMADNGLAVLQVAKSMYVQARWIVSSSPLIQREACDKGLANRKMNKHEVIKALEEE